MIIKLPSHRVRSPLEEPFPLAEFAIEISPLERHELHHAASISMKAALLNSSLMQYSEVDLHQWMAQSDHHVHGVRLIDTPESRELIGLIVCHANEEDFVADSLILSESFIGCGIEPEMIRAIAHLGIENGCGAVVLPIADHERKKAARLLYESLGGVRASMPTGQLEIAFASLAVDEVVAMAEAAIGHLIAVIEAPSKS